MASKQRLDLLLVEKGLFPSREKAKSAIMAGIVKVDGKTLDKAGTEVPGTASIEVIGPSLAYVSRGGLKLEKAIKHFAIDLKGKTIADIGASTGGFTDCALQNGAAKVYSIDVGYGQLDWKLRNDPRVVNLERTNFRYFDPNILEKPVDFATIDVSFISLEKILVKVADILQNNGRVVALIKPQFEAGREKVGKKGVVRDRVTHEEVILKILKYAEDVGFDIVGLTFSPIKGPEGNIEYLAYMSKKREEEDPEKYIYNHDIIKEIVSEAFNSL